MEDSNAAATKFESEEQFWQGKNTALAPSLGSVVCATKFKVEVMVG